MSLSASFSPVAEMLLKLPQAKITKGLALVLLAYIAYLFAKMTWLLLDEPMQNTYVPTSRIISQSDNSSQRFNLAEIKALNLFGLYNASPVVEEAPQEIEEAPETNLNLTLTGVVASDDETLSTAIVEHNGAQEIYGIDETITGTRAVLKNVYNDRVLIRHSGRLETLMLDGHNYTEANNRPAQSRAKAQPFRGPKQTNNSGQSKRLDQRSNSALTQQAKALKRDLNQNPSKITDYLKIGPKRVNGKIVGYQLMPGRNPEFFQSSGLQHGDVAIQMNGYDLSQPSEAAQALQALKREREISLLVDRGGNTTEILFSIDE